MGNAGLVSESVPEVQHRFHVRDLPGAIDHEHRTTVHGDIAFVPKRREQVFKVSPVIGLTRIGLLHQHATRRPVPDACPRLVGPAKTKREIRSPLAMISLTGRSKSRLPPNQ
jgi:hypothetical protein